MLHELNIHINIYTWNQVLIQDLFSQADGENMGKVGDNNSHFN